MSLSVLYEDNHLIAVNKRCGDIVQPDKSGDTALEDEVKEFIKTKYHKPGAVFLGVTHRIDRPVSGIVLFARTSKALERVNTLFREKTIKKTYWAIVANRPEQTEATLTNFIRRNEKQNKSFISTKATTDSKEAILEYKLLSSISKYHLLEVLLHTGRHHQIRCQLAHMGSPIKGDLKYGYPRSNPDGGIDLHARKLEFIHPVTQVPVCIIAPVPKGGIWENFDLK
ncbi:MAG TPA: RluA family pseudouridine synthase [Bacteroidales bacterium]|nr:RluA family pseudouridine synthase [Bacteroidales bacterium]HOE04075.1 RluA family pseudouridine synthase [Bacteroidales bacterium]